MLFGKAKDVTSCAFIVLDTRSNPLHVLEKHLLAAAVIKLCGPAVGVAGDSLSGFKGAVIFQKIRDAGRASIAFWISAKLMIERIGLTALQSFSQ
jgi:hypothetical protein